MARIENNSDFRRILKTAKSAGWQTVLTGNSHWKFVPPHPGTPPIFFSGSPSDIRSIKNFVARLRRCGLKLPR